MSRAVDVDVDGVGLVNRGLCYCSFRTNEEVVFQAMNEMSE